MTVNQSTSQKSKKESIESAFAQAKEITISGERIANVIKVATMRNTSFTQGVYNIKFATNYNKAKKQAEYLTYKIEARLLNSNQVTKLNTLVNSKVLRERTC